MDTSLILDKFEKLPVIYQKEANDFIEFLLSKTQKENELDNGQRNGFGYLKGKIKMSDDFDEPLDIFNEYT